MLYFELAWVWKVHTTEEPGSWVVPYPEFLAISRYWRMNLFARIIPSWSPTSSKVPDVSKARESLGFVADTPIETVLDELIPWVKDGINSGWI